MACQGTQYGLPGFMIIPVNDMFAFIGGVLDEKWNP